MERVSPKEFLRMGKENRLGENVFLISLKNGNVYLLADLEVLPDEGDTRIEVYDEWLLGKKKDIKSFEQAVLEAREIHSGQINFDYETREERSRFSSVASCFLAKCEPINDEGRSIYKMSTAESEKLKHMKNGNHVLIII